jgi:hypothetical protein
MQLIALQFLAARYHASNAHCAAGCLPKKVNSAVLAMMRMMTDPLE